MAEVDRRVVRDYRIGLVQMMELAGRGLAEQARAMLGGSVVGRKIIVLCGMGNNGGGGMVAARHLHGAGHGAGGGAGFSPQAVRPTARRAAIRSERFIFFSFNRGLTRDAAWPVHEAAGTT